MADISSGRIRFSTDDLPEPERFPAFCEEFVRRVVALDVVRRGDAPFRGMVEMRRAGAVDLGVVVTSSADYARTPTFIRDGDDSLFAVLFTQGTAFCTQGAHRHRLEPGKAIICDSAELGGLSIKSDTRYWSVRMPRSRVSDVVPHAGRFAGTQLKDNHLSLRLLFGYLEATRIHDLGADDRAAQLFGDHLIDLAAHALGTTGAARELVTTRGVRAARLVAVFNEVSKRLSDPGLSAAGIAAVLGVSPRYIHRLLEGTGQTFSQYVLDRRLDRAVDLLRAPRGATERIADIAIAVGFSDVSYFNRRFRRRFGDTPSGVRHAAPTNDR
ncbi:MAG TPA: helix-turn-helix domain-containing protein [Xanthobacteraceae bacterium]|nr:helix-turn-helix domain-containing protein [Xanthobacteraceae bacterium]